MRQRAFPRTAGDMQGLPDRVFAPHRRLASIGPVLRGCVPIGFARCPGAVLMDIANNGLRALGNRYLLHCDLPSTTIPVAIESLRQSAIRTQKPVKGSLRALPLCKLFGVDQTIRKHHGR